MTVPTIESFQSIPFIPYGETVECCETLELALCTKTPCECFSQYLELSENKIYYLLLYMRIKSYELKYEDEDFDRNAIAVGILDDFFNSNSPFKIPERLEYSEDLASKIKSKLNKDTFNCLYSLFIGNLKAYYEEFKTSEMYYNLRDELLKMEIAYERLNAAGLI